jgi:hypothetical protein
MVHELGNLGEREVHQETNNQKQARMGRRLRHGREAQVHSSGLAWGTQDLQRRIFMLDLAMMNFRAKRLCEQHLH